MKQKQHHCFCIRWNRKKLEAVLGLALLILKLIQILTVLLDFVRVG